MEKISDKLHALQRWYKEEIKAVDIGIFLSFVGCVAYFIYYVASNLNDDGTICLRTMVCATTPAQVGLLFVSRICAGLIYPALFVVMISKLAYTRAGLSHSFLSELIDFGRFHVWHKSCGKIMFFAGIIHAIAHTIRLLLNGQGYDLRTHPTGRTGIVGTILMVVFVSPVLFKFLKVRVRYEIRKFIHYTFIAFLADMCGHTQTMLYVNISLLGAYLIDYALSMLFLTYRIDHAKFEAIGRGIAVTFPIPEKMGIVPGQYIYLNVPWISTYQWHAFSLMVDVDFDHKSKFKGYLYINAVGDFTQKLYMTSLALKHRPVLWINGPHPSPFMHSVNYSKLILVASGAGITPAISVVDQYHSQRKVFLIFVTNDASMVRFFSRKLGKVKSFVFFTGKDSDFEKLQLYFEQKFAKVNLENPVELMKFESLVTDPDAPRPVSMPEKPFVQHNDLESGAYQFHDIDPVIAEEPDTCPNSLQEEKESGKPTNVTAQINPLERRYHASRVNHQPTASFINKTLKGDTVNLMKGRPNVRNELKSIIDTEEHERRFLMAKRKTLASSSFLKDRDLDEPTMLIEASLSDWAVMYCGASKPLNVAIQDACDTLGLRYTSEYFDSW